jgi:poly-gamma-glutamate synthesis protein (capsule biosynthesis protein)
LDPAATEYGVPYIYNSNFAEDIQRLRDAGAEVVIAFPHCGTEYVTQPDASQLDYAEKLASAGADIILGGHSHAVQPMMLKRMTDSAGRSRDVLIAFSLGNFLSDHRLQYTDCGVIVEFTISEDNDGAFSVGGIGYIPTYCWQPTRGDVRVLPSGKYLIKGPAGMTGEAHARLVQSYHEITGIIGNTHPVLET